MAPPPAELHEEPALDGIVPARAVLTELARGFLLVRESDRERAVRFAATFLRERAEAPTRGVPAPVPVTAPAQGALGRYPRGAVERLDPRGFR